MFSVNLRKNIFKNGHFSRKENRQYLDKLKIKKHPIRKFFARIKYKRLNIINMVLGKVYVH